MGRDERRIGLNLDSMFGLAGLRQIVGGLPTQPELGVGPSRLLQSNGHCRRNGGSAVQYTGERVAGHTQDFRRLGDAQTEWTEAVLFDAEAGMRRILHGHGLEPLLMVVDIIRVSGNWRIVFRFVEGEAVDVDLIDYH